MLIQDLEATKDPVQRLVSNVLYPGNDKEPVRSSAGDEPNTWVYKGRVFRIEGGDHIGDDELKLRVKHEALRHTREIERITREVEAFENFDRLPSARRERIPDHVRYSFGSETKVDAFNVAEGNASNLTTSFQLWKWQ